MHKSKPLAATEAYEKLIRGEKERSLLVSTDALLSWDESVYMPTKGATLRGEQKALIARYVHQSLSSKETGDLLASAGEVHFPRHSAEEANVREIRRSHLRATKLPTRLVEELARAASAGTQAWIEARSKSDFSIFAPVLKKIVELKCEEAKAIGYEKDSYDAFFDSFEPGESITDVTPLFDQLKPELVKLLAKIQASAKKPKSEILTQLYSLPKQKQIGEMAAGLVGFDFTRGRLDTTHHPFCSGFGTDDVRITTRYDEHSFNDSFSSILHEAGHGMYEQGLDPKYEGTPAARACSFAIHESQSRIWENYVAKGKPFWDFFYPQTQALFPENLKSVSAEDFLLAVNEVRPSFIRVEADEVTYNLHIILRLEMERAILSGDLAINDIPGAWNEKFEALFGIRPPDDAQGCLQDVHWSGCMFGYFPTYALGNMYGAQFVERADQDLGGLGAQFREGKFAPFLGWLREKIHLQGQRFTASELCVNVTRKKLGCEALVRQLNKKFGALYGF